jgi:hypothetical protein
LGSFVDVVHITIHLGNCFQLLDVAVNRVSSFFLPPSTSTQGVPHVSDLAKMTWPYHFLDLTTEEKHARNQTLNRYATFVQLSALAPVAGYLVYLAVTWAAEISKRGRGSYDAVPSSPSLKTRRQSNVGTWDAGIRKWVWWLSDDVVLFGQVWGQRDQWIFGTLWAAWMLTLCFPETGHGTWLRMSCSRRGVLTS